MSQYDSAIALALRLIKKFGRPVTFNQLGTASDPSTPWKSSAPSVVNTVTQPAVFVSLSIRDLGLDLTQVDLEKRATEALLTAPGTLDLFSVHQIVDDKTYTILWIKALKPGPDVVIYAMGIAR